MLLHSPQVHLDGQTVMTEGHRKTIESSLLGSVGVLAGMGISAEDSALSMVWADIL